MQGLPPIDLFTGTWEDFYPDVVNTYNKVKAARRRCPSACS